MGLSIIWKCFCSFSTLCNSWNYTQKKDYLSTAPYSTWILYPSSWPDFGLHETPRNSF